MNILVTAGNTQTPIDRVRCITNIFSGWTGAHIAIAALRREHTVTLLTSQPDLVHSTLPTFTVRSYRTFDDLATSMATLLADGRFDVLIHSAAVSDYHLMGTYAPATGTHFDPMTGSWTNGKLIDVSAGKVKSHHPELWLRLEPTTKLADIVRTTWGFRGVFVKFKLEVGITEEELRRIAERSRAQSDADLIVANTLEGKDAVAWIGDRASGWEQVSRAELAQRLIERIEGVQTDGH
jgi:phosphopantothenate---cysteine ligase (CTP)